MPETETKTAPPEPKAAILQKRDHIESLPATDIDLERLARRINGRRNFPESRR
jgi:hypothetical protein